MSLENPNVIDFVTLDPEGTVCLVMVEGRQWETDDQLFELQEKVNAYAAYALDGALVDTYPHLAGRPVRIELRAAALPENRFAAFIDRVKTSLTSVDLRFDVVKLADRPLG